MVPAHSVWPLPGTSRVAVPQTRIRPALPALMTASPDVAASWAFWNRSSFPRGQRPQALTAVLPSAHPVSPGLGLAGRGAPPSGQCPRRESRGALPSLARGSGLPTWAPVFTVPVGSRRRRSAPSACCGPAARRARPGCGASPCCCFLFCS